MFLRKGILLIIVFSAISLFARQDHGAKTNLSYTRLTSGLNVPQFKSGRSDFVMNDINDDGHVDLLSIGDHGSPGIHQNGIMVWFNDGQGSFTFYQTGNFGYGGIAVGDVNNDGFKDVGYSMHHNYSSTNFGDQLIEVALGDGTGMNWTPYDEGLATNGEFYGMFGTDLGDVNNNGLLDLASIAFGSGPGFHVYLNQGDGSWTPSFGLLGNNSDYLIQFADLNNDGYLDFIAGHALGTAYFGDGNGDFTNNDNGLPYYGFYSSRHGISVGDVNNDGSHGLAFINDQGGVEVWEFDQDDDIWVNYSGNLPTSGSFQRTQLFDMNADGYTDVMAYGNRTFQLWLGDGQGNWTPDATFQTDFPSGAARAFRAGGDLNQNGHGDIVILANEGTWITNQNKLYVYAENTVPSELWIRNLYPKGHEKFYPGSVRFIEWASAVPDNAPSYVKIEISANGPDGPWALVADSLPNNGRHQWHMPNHASENCHLKLTVITDDETAVQINEVPFKILGDDEDQYFDVVFNVSNIHGDHLDNAIITIDDIEHEPGHYQLLLEAGSYQYSIANDCYLTADGELVVTDNLQVDVVLDNLNGDANGDGIVNVLDVISVVNHYLDLNPEPFCTVNADANMDGIINVLDIIEIVSLFSKAF